MNKKTMRTWAGAALMLFLMFAWMGPSMKSDAAESKPSIRKSIVIEVDQNTGIAGRYLNLDQYAEDAKISAVKSSKPSVAVATVAKVKSKGIFLRIEKPGKTKVTFKVTQGGKTYKMSTVVTVRKPPNPIASFKVGSKNYASKYNDYTYYGIKAPSKASKVSVRLKKGYKLESISIFSEGVKSNNSKIIKNGSKVKASGVSTQITVNYTYKMNGQISYGRIYLTMYK